MMNTIQQKQVIEFYRNNSYAGLSIDLVPLCEDDLSCIVSLRNQNHSKYYLSQSRNISLDDQSKWYADYKNRSDDIYWCIKNKENSIVGTVRLYNITANNCEHGSFIIDEKFAMGTPFALEAMILSLDFAFDTLNLKTVECNDKEDNSNMNSITRKFGFQLIGTTTINEDTYNHYILRKEDCLTKKYIPLLQKIVARGN